MQHEELKRMELFSSNIQNEISRSILFKKNSTKFLPGNVEQIVNIKESEKILINPKNQSPFEKLKDNKITNMSRIFQIGAHVPSYVKINNTSDSIIHGRPSKLKSFGGSITDVNKDPINKYLTMLEELMNNQEETKYKDNSRKIF